MTVTNRSKTWEMVNSIPIVATFLLGFGNWLTFFYFGLVVKRKRWIYYGFLYALPLILTIIIGKFTDFTFYGVIVSGIISIIHAFKIREEFLIRYDKKLKNELLQENDIENIIHGDKINSSKETFEENNNNKEIYNNLKLDKAKEIVENDKINNSNPNTEFEGNNARKVDF